MTVDKNLTWDRMHFLKIIHFTVMYKKITQKRPD